MSDSISPADPGISSKIPRARCGTIEWNSSPWRKPDVGVGFRCDIPGRFFVFVRGSRQAGWDFTSREQVVGKIRIFRRRFCGFTISYAKTDAGDRRNSSINPLSKKRFKQIEIVFGGKLND